MAKTYSIKVVCDQDQVVAMHLTGLDAALIRDLLSELPRRNLALAAERTARVPPTSPRPAQIPPGSAAANAAMQRTMARPVAAAPSVAVPWPPYGHVPGAAPRAPMPAPQPQSDLDRAAAAVAARYSDRFR